MAVKVQIGGKKLSITGPGKCPITFVNGEKKRLVKGITFVDGKKVILWDSHSLEIDVIEGLYSSMGRYTYPLPVMATRDKLVLTDREGYVYRYDVSNPSNPIKENEVEMGTVCGYSLPDSTDDKQVFFALSSSAAQCVNVNPITAEITADKQIIPKLSLDWIGFLDSGYLGYINAYAVRFYTQDGQKYSFVKYTMSSGTGLVGTYYDDIMLAKRDGNSFIGTEPAQGAPAIATYTADSVQPRITGKHYGSIMVDDNGYIVAGGLGGFGIFTAGYDVVKQVDCMSANRCCKVVGRIRDYYYVVEGPETADADQRVVLRVFSRDGEEIEQRVLDVPAPRSYPSGSASGFIVWCNVMPQVSKTGALIFSYRTGSNVLDSQSAVVVRIRGY